MPATRNGISRRAGRTTCPHQPDPDVGRLSGCARGKTQNLRFGLAQGGGWAARSPGNWAVRGYRRQLHLVTKVIVPLMRDSPARRAARLSLTVNVRVARQHDDGRRGKPRYGSRVGTWGPGAFDNDDALDLLDALSGQDTAARRQVLEQIFRDAREHAENLNFTLGAAEVVAAAAVVAAGLPAGGAVAQEITRHDYDVTALVIPGSGPALARRPRRAAHRGRARRRLAPGLDRPPDSAAPPDHGPARLGLLPRPAPARSGTTPGALTARGTAHRC